MAPTGEPKEGTRPQPIGSAPLVVLFTTCTLCFLFIIWRRADGLRRVVAHGLKTLREPRGQIRLSTDDGPPANEFLADDLEYEYDADPAALPADGPLAHQIRHTALAWREPGAGAGGGGGDGRGRTEGPGPGTLGAPEVPVWPVSS